MMTHSSPKQFMSDLQELMEMLQGAATHVSLVGLRRLEARLQKTLYAGRSTVWNLNAASGDRNKHSKGLFAPACLLLDVLMTTEKSEPGYDKLEKLFRQPVDFSCVVCSTSANQIAEPLIVDCCKSLFCKACICEPPSSRQVVKCPCCKATLGFNNFTNLRKPLNETISGSSAAAPSLDMSNRALATLPPRQELGRLKVWECDGAIKTLRPGESIEDTDASCKDGFISRKPIKFKADGMHFCSRDCVNASFERALYKDLFGQFQLCSEVEAKKNGMPSGWCGSLAGKIFSSKEEAKSALQAKLKDMAKQNLSWQGKPLYPRGTYTRRDLQYPNCSKFRSLEASVDDGTFVAHYDAAGGERPYGVHPLTRLGTKLDAVVACVEALPGKATEGGSKVVIFSAWHSTLCLLFDALKLRYDSDSIALVSGADSNAELNHRIDKFRSDPRCFVLLLEVRKCATGLTLTCADHCFLVELQRDEAIELQLVNRIWRIGQTKPVVVKKFLMMDTVELRLHQRRSHAGGLFADMSDETDRIALPPSNNNEDESNNDGSDGDEDNSNEASSAADFRHFEELRDLFGLSG